MISIKDIEYGYGKGKNILENITFDVEQNHFIAIMGNNGAGKSTLIKCLNKVITAKGGSVIINGKNLFEMSRNDVAKNIAYVAQNRETSRITVYDTILLGRKPYIQWEAKKEDHDLVVKMMNHMNIQDYALRYIDELSGGELQKVMLARALVQQPKFLLLDEPTSALDPYNQYALMKLVKHISLEHNIAVAIVIHDLNLAMRYCDKFLFLKDKMVYAYGGLEVMTPKIIKDIYNLEAEIIDYKGIKLLVPLPDESLTHHHSGGSEHIHVGDSTTHIHVYAKGDHVHADGTVHHSHGDESPPHVHGEREDLHTDADDKTSHSHGEGNTPHIHGSDGTPHVHDDGDTPHIHGSKGDVHSHTQGDVPHVHDSVNEKNTKNE